MIACDSYLSLFFFTLQKKLRSGAIVRFSDNSSLTHIRMGHLLTAYAVMPFTPQHPIWGYYACLEEFHGKME